MSRRSSKRTKGDAYTTSADFLMMLLHTPVDRFFEKDSVIFVAERDNKVLDVWKGLVEKNFLSVPVLQKTEHLYYGSLDLVDIVRHVVHQFKDEKVRGDENFWSQVSEAKAFESVTVNDIAQYPLNRRNQFHPVRKGYSLLYACELLAREQDLHRVPVVDTDRQLVNLVTQSKVIEFVHSQAQLVGDKLQKPIELCAQLFHDVISVSEDLPAIDAFDKMVSEKVTGLAVVDSQGKLVDNLSVRDIKAVGSSLSNFWRFYSTTKQYLHNLRFDFGDKRPAQVLFVTPQSTLGDALDIMATNHVHRVFIVESKDSMLIKGVVSLKDMLLEIITP